jgi:hypothetical protein
VNFKRKRNRAVLAMALVAVCVGFPQNGFSKDERAGLYAGPLSVVVETIVEKVKPVSENASDQLGETPQRYRGETSSRKNQAAQFEEKNPLSSPSTPQ